MKTTLVSAFLAVLLLAAVPVFGQDMATLTVDRSVAVDAFYVSAVHTQIDGATYAFAVGCRKTNGDCFALRIGNRFTFRTMDDSDPDSYKVGGIIVGNIRLYGKDVDHPDVDVSAVYFVTKQRQASDSPPTEQPKRKHGNPV